MWGSCDNQLLLVVVVLFTVFGFLETTYRGVERGQPHELAIGRTSGIIPGQLVITVDLRLGTGTGKKKVIE